MNADIRRSELLKKGNELIDTISESMRTIENVEAAKKKFLRPDSMLMLEMPIPGTDEFTDVFKLNAIFNARSIENIKAYVLTQLELLEDDALRILETAGFTSFMKAPEAAVSEETTENWESLEKEEDDSDMIIIPDRIENKAKQSHKPLAPETVKQIQKLANEGLVQSEIAKRTGVSQQSVSRYINKYAETVPNNKTQKSGRSASNS